MFELAKRRWPNFRTEAVAMFTCLQSFGVIAFLIVQTPLSKRILKGNVGTIFSFFLHLALATFLYFAVCLSDPGFIDVRPHDLEEVVVESPSAQETGHLLSDAASEHGLVDASHNGEELRICVVCRATRPPRSKHCRECGRCVARFDHHCPFMGNCIGLRNHGLFVFFLLAEVSLVLRCFLSSLIVFQPDEDAGGMLILARVAFLIFLGFALMMSGMLTCMHVWLAFTGFTTREIMMDDRYAATAEVAQLGGSFYPLPYQHFAPCRPLHHLWRFFAASAEQSWVVAHRATAAQIERFTQRQQQRAYDRRARPLRAERNVHDTEASSTRSSDVADDDRTVASDRDNAITTGTFDMLSDTNSSRSESLVSSDDPEHALLHGEL
ncbi:MAG: hypothetical protein MHM6MM_000311 [Cercozoa sp. M6MM]